MTNAEINDMLTTVELLAKAQKRRLSTIDCRSINNISIQEIYDLAAKQCVLRLKKHIRILKRNAFASQIRAFAESSLAMIAIESLLNENVNKHQSQSR